MEWYSIRQLSIQTNKSQEHIKSYIRNELDNNLLLNIDEIFDNVKYVMIDWIWISTEICLIIYYEYRIKKVLRFWFYDWEKLDYISKDLSYIKHKFKYEIEAFIVDWWLQIISAIKKIYPEAIIQRCLIHIHRQVRLYISKNPKTDCWRELNKIVVFKLFNQKWKFIELFEEWSIKWDNYLKEKTYWKKRYWYKHKKLRQAKSHIKNAIPFMFNYLDNCNIDNNTNKLEWLNALISEQVYNHRWIREDRLKTLLTLWLYYRNYKNL